MNPPIPPPIPAPTRSCSTLGRIFAVLGVLILGLLLAGFLAGVAVLRNWNPPTDLPDVRSALVQSLDIPTKSEIEVAIPTWVMTLGRVGISLADLGSEVTAGLKSVRGGQVGVYELVEAPKRERQLALIETADALLHEAGDWTRIVTVLDEQDLVAIYAVESALDSDRKADLMLIVMDHRDLVIASVRTYTEPLLEVASAAIEQIDLGDPPSWIEN